MNRLFSLLKAVMSQDMNLFVYKAHKGSSNAKKLIIPIILSLFVMYAIGMYYYGFAIELSKVNLTYVLLTIAVAFPSFLTVIEGIYKVPSIIFEPKDNDLLFSLPIDKKVILLVRIIKLYIFQLMYSVLFTLPGLIIYALFEHPTVSFYIISAIMLILMPVIPTILACILGYAIKRFSIKFKAKRFVQVVVTFAIFLMVFLTSFNSSGVISSFVENASKINDSISKFYYPIRAYLLLVKEFNVLELIKLLVINIAMVLLFIWILGINYFKTISKSSERYINSNNKKSLSFKQNNSMKALISKELKRYFSSTVYIFNTMFGLVLLLIATVYLCTNFDNLASIISDEESIQDFNTMISIVPKLFYAMIIGMSFMTSITSSSISIEGKTFNISKSLPVKVEKILLSKIATSNLISIPFILACDLIFCLSFDVTIFDILTILVISFVAPTISAIIGLLINLKYPKMNASSDAEIVKQSMSSMISVFVRNDDGCSTYRIIICWRNYGKPCRN